MFPGRLSHNKLFTQTVTSEHQLCVAPCFISTQHALWTPKYQHNLCGNLHPICCRCTRLCHSGAGCALQISCVTWQTSPAVETGQRAQTARFILSDCADQDIQNPLQLDTKPKWPLLTDSPGDGKKPAGCAVFWDALAKILRDLFKNIEMLKLWLVIAKIQRAPH